MTFRLWRCFNGEAYPGQSDRPPSVRQSVPHTFGFLFCKRPKDRTKRQEDIVVANMVAGMAADMEAHMVGDMFADIKAQFCEKKKKGYPIW